MALKSDGSLYTFGLNNLGQLADGGTGNRNTPYLVTGLQPVAAIAAGGNHTLAVLSSVAGSTIKASGKNANGQLGSGTTSGGATSNPVSVNLLSGVASASAGTSYSLAVKLDSTAYGWGYNGYFWADIRHVQQLLGHKDLRTTAIYARVDVSDLRRVLERAHPRERRRGVE